MLVLRYFQLSQNKIRSLVSLSTHFSDVFKLQLQVLVNRCFDILEQRIFTSHWKTIKCTSVRNERKEKEAPATLIIILITNDLTSQDIKTVCILENPSVTG